MVNTLELTDVPGYEGQTIVIRKLGFGSLTQLRSKILKTKANVKQGEEDADVDATVDIGLYQKWLVVYAVSQAPFWVGCPTVELRAKFVEQDGLSAEAGQYLFEKAREFNNIEKVEDTKKE